MAGIWRNLREPQSVTSDLQATLWTDYEVIDFPLTIQGGPKCTDQKQNTAREIAKHTYSCTFILSSDNGTLFLKGRHNNGNVGKTAPITLYENVN